MEELEIAEKEMITKKYFKLHNAIKNEKQFNRKIELNSKINQFKRDNNLIVKTNDPIITLSINGETIARIQKHYSNKKVDLTYRKLKKETLTYLE